MDDTTNKQNSESEVYIIPEFSDNDTGCASNDIPLYTPKKYKKILVLSGGGAKGVGYIGAFKALENKGYLDKFKIFAGTSIGTFIMSLYVVGYTPDEMFGLLSKFDMRKVGCIKIANILSEFGLDNGENIVFILKRLFKAKGYDPEITLKTLYNLTNKKLIFTTVCLNTQEACYFSYENQPDLPLHLAIRMSISVPIFYTPVSYKDKLYIDGGCIDNYPIQLFSDQLDNVFGIYLSEDKKPIKSIETLDIYLLLVIRSLLEGINHSSINGYDDYTVYIKTNASSLNYSICNDKIREMFMCGYNAIIQHLLK